MYYFGGALSFINEEPNSPQLRPMESPLLDDSFCLGSMDHTALLLNNFISSGKIFGKKQLSKFLNKERKTGNTNGCIEKPLIWNYLNRRNGGGFGMRSYRP